MVLVLRPARPVSERPPAGALVHNSIAGTRRPVARALAENRSRAPSGAERSPTACAQSAAAVVRRTVPLCLLLSRGADATNREQAVQRPCCTHADGPPRAVRPLSLVKPPGERAALRRPQATRCLHHAHGGVWTVRSRWPGVPTELRYDALGRVLTSSCSTHNARRTFDPTLPVFLRPASPRTNAVRCPRRAPVPITRHSAYESPELGARPQTNTRLSSVGARGGGAAGVRAHACRDRRRASAVTVPRLCSMATTAITSITTPLVCPA